MLREHRKAVASPHALRLASSAGSQARRAQGFLGRQATVGPPGGSREPAYSPDAGNDFDGMVGTSRQMRQVYERIQTIGPTSSPVLINGETGTGKELVARSLHRRSSRAARPFVPVNACAIVDTLFEAQLFGHEAGAFTDCALVEGRLLRGSQRGHAVPRRDRRPAGCAAGQAAQGRGGR